MTDRLPGQLDPRALSAARRALHHAAQLVSGVGDSLLPARADYTHSAVAWSEDHGPRLVGQPLPSGHRVALQLLDGALVVDDASGAAVARLTVAGSTPADALAKLGEALVACGAAARGVKLSAPDWDMPPLDGPTLPAVDAAAAAELARWYGLASLILEDVKRAWAGASDVIVWPHHFDIATLIAIDPDPHAAGARSVGVGLSPGDGSYDEPYVYVSPYPAPETLPPLRDVEARDSGWIGYVIRGSTVAGWAADGRAARLADAVQRAVKQAHALAKG